MTTEQARNKVANIFFGSIIIAWLVMSYGAYVATEVFANQPIEEIKKLDDNLTSSKPAPYWRLNSNGYSQRFVVLTGTTRDERAIQLLQAYDMWEQERNTIKVIARIHRIFPEVILAIAYSDSSLWKHLKTSFNYWNVWNSSDWRTQSYTTMEAGFDAIGRVLKNRNLGRKQTIGDLYPNYGYCTIDCGTVYASSPENAAINTLNALSLIHNKQVNTDFAFRR